MTTATHPSAQADALIARYHAAQAALDAHATVSNDGVARQSLPTAQVRANILAHAARLAQERGAVPVTPDAIDSGASYAYGTRAKDQFGNKKKAANDSQWKIRAVASVAILGLTGLLLTQWDRATPQEKEVAFGMERPAPVAPDAAPPAAAAPPPAPAVAVPAVAAPTAPADTAAKPAPVAPPARNPSPKAGPARLPQANDEATRGTVVAESAPLLQAAPVAAAPAPAPAAEPGIAAAPVAAAEMGVTPPPLATAGTAARARAPMALPNAASAGKAAGVAPSATAQAGRDAAPARLMSPNMALFAAIRDADAPSLQLALTRGADKNAQSNGTPAIALCVQANQLALVRLLAAAGADLNAADAQGLSPLAHAQAKGLDEMVQMLLELGAK